MGALEMHGLVLGRLSMRCEGNIKMDLKEKDFEKGRWMELALECVQWLAVVFKLWVLLPEN
jgi:hypothetical protein